MRSPSWLGWLACAVTTALGCEDSTRSLDARAALAPQPPANISPVEPAAPLTVVASSEPPPPAPESPEVPRLYAKTRFVWVYPEPDARTQWIGYLRTGSAVQLRSARGRAGVGCAAFYEIEPRGFVCGDGPRATLDANDPIYRALLPYAAKTDSAWPHQYAESLGLVRYFSAPTPEYQKMREGDLRAHLKNIESARAGQVPRSLEGVDLTVPDTLPPEIPQLPVTVFEDRKELKRRSTVAYGGEARFGDRAFLMSGDFAWVPKDRVRPYPQVTFRGLRLGVDAKLPLAFFRAEKRRAFRRTDAGQFVAEGEPFARLSHVELSGKSERVDGERYLETVRPGVWLRELDAVVPRPAARTPWGAATGADDDGEKTPKGRASWIEISIEGGWLLAFEGTRAVYATLVSPGRGGLARPGEDPLERSATPGGTYPISGKFVNSTMVAPGELVHSDVPFAQNIVGPYALHAAYWHDNWGNPQSGGCLNLSPIDAKWMFDFTDPKLPEGWYGVRWVPAKGPATRVVLHR